MNVKDIVKKALAFGEKYKYVLLVALVGLGLLLWPSGRGENDQAAAEVKTAPLADGLDTRLENVLSQMEGAGQVKVLLTYLSGGESILAENIDADGSVDTVLADGGSGEAPVVVESRSPEYRGALVVCTGGDVPAVRLDIVEAVSALTGLGADKITVVKMKSS